MRPLQIASSQHVSCEYLHVSVCCHLFWTSQQDQHSAFPEFGLALTLTNTNRSILI